ncbi:glycerol-3-phosphate dehydrogenase/oxidase [Alkalihalobacillus trypoxylicola]|uniref:Aerobic glycerol-3-phosphate dehydrogenase n=1 Tax=Alkalihalobacillus trypoxylicola TaxID=519424 RepID=A0A162E5N5_9BACI|nr:glycerol-3-phosphate dehydrogenase/oxidase [Alkalihalobacillus trypoxylicola]KYG31796.1 hypothetical protein AZF04_03175 [Alkalihalobacillus trypoxylicola]
MNHSFSSENRENMKNEMKTGVIDLLIIGGGIAGAGILLDAQVRGVSSVILEMNDFASGASGHSTKLCHGGFRHTKQFDMKRSAELAKERAIIHENAPHLTRPEPMLIPIYKEGPFDRWKTSIGLKMFDHLTDVKKRDRGEMLSKKQTLKIEPSLNGDRLKGSGLYIEYRMEDARLTLEIIKEAVKRGAKALNYMKVESFIYENGVAIGVIAVDLTSGEAIKLYAKKIVNATGAWLDRLREQDRSLNDTKLKLVKGLHLVFDSSVFSLKYGVYFKSKMDDKMICAVPYHNKIYVGMSETDIEDVSDVASYSESERDYLLENLGHFFPQLNLEKEDIISYWTGVRTFVQKSTKSKNDEYSNHEIIISDSKIISVMLGTLTAYRITASKVVDGICEQLKITNPSETESITLSGGHVGGSDLFSNYVKKMTKAGKELELSEQKINQLVERYGSNIGNIFAKMRTNKRHAKRWDLPSDLYAEIRYGIEEEMVMSPLDFFSRRTSYLYFEPHYVKENYKMVLHYFSDYFHWSPERLQIETNRMEEALASS